MSLDPRPSDAELLAMAERRRKNVLYGGSATVLEANELPCIVWPVKLTIPWSHLISDNRRHGVIDGRLLLTSDYRRCKGLVRELAKSKIQGEPAAFPLGILANVWVPDDTRAHDVCNFAKNVHDALETVVYTKDRYLYDVHWIRAGVDVDAPRAEITISRSALTQETTG